MVNIILKNKMGIERDNSALKKHILLSQRTLIWFPTPRTGGSQLPVTKEKTKTKQTRLELGSWECDSVIKYLPICVQPQVSFTALKTVFKTM